MTYLGSMGQVERAVRRLRERDPGPTDTARGETTHRHALDAVERAVQQVRRRDPALDDGAALTAAFVADPEHGDRYAAAVQDRLRSWQMVEDRATRLVAEGRAIDCERAIDHLLRTGPDARTLYREHYWPPRCAHHLPRARSGASAPPRVRRPRPSRRKAQNGGPA
jgi:hypothetical protein